MDAKKAQQSLESTYKQLDSVSLLLEFKGWWTQHTSHFYNAC